MHEKGGSLELMLNKQTCDHTPPKIIKKAWKKFKAKYLLETDENTYFKVRKLGGGGFGVVFLCVNEESFLNVAVKKIGSKEF